MKGTHMTLSNTKQVCLVYTGYASLSRSAVDVLFSFRRIAFTYFVSDSSVEVVKISKRNTEDSITAARQRFMERKRARDQKQDR